MSAILDPDITDDDPKCTNDRFEQKKKNEVNMLINVKMLINTEVTAIFNNENGGRPPSWMSVS